MRLLLATPLYPPEIAPPAPYIKELAQRLAGRYEVTIVAYGRLPEHIPGVHIISVDKRASLPVRLWRYTRALRIASKSADLVYAMNGASVELPALLQSRPFILGFADDAAHTHAARSLPFHMLERIAAAHARSVITQMPLAKPEIIPLDPEPTEALAAYEASWEEHLRALETAFNHA